MDYTEFKMRNKLKLKLAKQRYYEKYKEKLLYKMKKYRKIHKEKLRLQTKEYYKKYPWKKTWIEINTRCYNKNHHSFKDYGDRGIENCFSDDSEIEYLWNRDKAWLLKWPCISRKDNDGNYCIDNCEFIEKGLNSAERNIRVALKNRQNKLFLDT
jgi:hypothetical protein